MGNNSNGRVLRLSIYSKRFSKTYRGCVALSWPGHVAELGQSDVGEYAVAVSGRVVVTGAENTCHHPYIIPI